MCSDDALPCSPALNRPLRSEAQALADHIETLSSKSVDDNMRAYSVINDHAALIIRALRAYKPAPLEPREKRMLEALEALHRQALQSDVAKPENEWGWEALNMANAVIAECHEAQGKPAPVTDTHRDFDGDDA